MTIIRIPIDSELSTYPPTQSTICYGKLGVCPEIVINSFAWDNNVTCRCRFVLVVEYLPEWNNRMAERNRCPLIGLYCRWTTHHLFIRWSTNLFQRRVEYCRLLSMTYGPCCPFPFTLPTPPPLLLLLLLFSCCGHHHAPPGPISKMIIVVVVAPAASCGRCSGSTDRHPVVHYQNFIMQHNKTGTN